MPQLMLKRLSASNPPNKHRVRQRCQELGVVEGVFAITTSSLQTGFVNTQQYGGDVLWMQAGRWGFVGAEGNSGRKASKVKQTHHFLTRL